LRDTGSLDCARDDRFVWGCASEDARAYTDWRGLGQRSFVGSRVCATPLPQDDSGRLDYPWAFSRVGSSISGSGWPCPVSEVDGVRWSRFSFPTFPHRTRKDGAPGYWAGVRLSGAASRETQGPSTALGMTDCFASARVRTLAPSLFGGAWCRDPSLGVACGATSLPQDDSGRLACPWAFSRVGSSILGSDWPCPVSEMDGVRWSRFSVPTFPHRTRKDGAPACLAGVRLRDTGSLGCARDDRFVSGLHELGRSRLH
jgi:hypothetical protein